MLLDTLAVVMELIRKACPSNGLRTMVNVIYRMYETGREETTSKIETIRSTVQFHAGPPKGNYILTAQPERN